MDIMFETIAYMGRYVRAKTAALLFSSPEPDPHHNPEYGVRQAAATAEKHKPWSWSETAKMAAFIGGGLFVGATLGFGGIALAGLVRFGGTQRDGGGNSLQIFDPLSGFTNRLRLLFVPQAIGQAERDFVSSEEVAPALAQLFMPATPATETEAGRSSTQKRDPRTASSTAAIRPLMEEIQVNSFGENVNYPHVVYLPKVQQYLIMWITGNYELYYRRYTLEGVAIDTEERLLVSNFNSVISSTVLTTELPDGNMLVARSTGELGNDRGWGFILEARRQQDMSLAHNVTIKGTSITSCKKGLRIASTKSSFAVTWQESCYTSVYPPLLGIQFFSPNITAITPIYIAGNFTDTYKDSCTLPTLTSDPTGVIFSCHRSSYEGGDIYIHFDHDGQHATLLSGIPAGTDFHTYENAVGYDQALQPSNRCLRFQEDNPSGYINSYEVNTPYRRYSHHLFLLLFNIDSTDEAVANPMIASLYGNNTQGAIFVFQRDYYYNESVGKRDYRKQKRVMVPHPHSLEALELDGDGFPVNNVTILRPYDTYAEYSLPTIAIGSDNKMFASWVRLNLQPPYENKIMARLFSTSRAVVEESSIVDISSPNALSSSTQFLSKSDAPSRNNAWKIGLGVGAGVVLIGTVTGLALFGVFRSRRRAQTVELAPVYLIDTIKTENGDIRLGKCLGQGSFGKVFKGSWGTYGDVAIKQLNLLATEFDQKLLEDYVREADTMAKLRHPNIVQYYACFKDPENQYFYIGIEFMRGGPLTKYVEKNHNQPEYLNGLLPLLIGAAAGIAYLHENRIIHRDIKPDNILLTSDNVAKISDFGTAKITSAIEDQTRQQTKGMGTPIYMAPETLTPRPKYSTKSDVFSFGITLLQTVTGKEPYATWGSDYVIRILNGEREEIPASVDPELRNLITMCTTQDPESRPEMSEVLARLQTINSRLLSPPLPSQGHHIQIAQARA